MQLSAVCCMCSVVDWLIGSADYDTFSLSAVRLQLSSTAADEMRCGTVCHTVTSHNSTQTIQLTNCANRAAFFTSPSLRRTANWALVVVFSVRAG